jgi:hypothetical protein
VLATLTPKTWHLAPASQFLQNPAAGFVRSGQLNFYLVAREEANEIPFLHADGVRQHMMSFAQINPKNELR